MKKVLHYFGLILGFLIIQTQAISQIPTSGLVGWWPFTGNANDMSGNGNNGTVNNATLCPDRFGVTNSAYEFNGTNSFIQLANSSLFNMGSTFTISLWCRINTTSSIYGATFSKSNPSSWNTNDKAFLHSASRNVMTNICGVGDPYTITTISNYQWYHLVWVYGITYSTVYINAVSQAMNYNWANLPFPQDNLSSIVCIGKKGDGSYFYGVIDDVRFYNWALSQDDINALYQEGLPPSTQAINISFSNVQTNQFTFNWTDGNGSNRAVFILQDSVGTSSPVNNTTYTASTFFGSGTQIGSSGWYCVFNGTIHPSGVTVTNLQPNNNYRLMVCEYNGNPGFEQYTTSSAVNNPLTQKTTYTKLLNLKLYLEGLYVGGGWMYPAMDENGPHWGPTIADKITVELHSSASYPTISYTLENCNLNSNGTVVAEIPSAFNGNYYITIKHRNSIETTTATPVSLMGSAPVTYNFTTAASQAYGNNQKEIYGKWTIWGGDVNQDGIVDGGDMNEVDNATTAITFGYVDEDVNGDGVVDAGDMNIIDNNTTALIMANIPDNCPVPQKPTTGTLVANSTQIIWHWNTVTDATGYKWNTTNDYASATDMGTVATKTETGLTCNTAYTRYVWAYNSCGNSSVTTMTQTTSYCLFICGSSIAINHVAGTVAPVTKTVNYATVTNILGESSKCWITSNLGSDHQAASVDDATEASAGWYWQFNRKQGYKHDGTTRTPNTTWIDVIAEGFDWQEVNDPCTLELGIGWRIPTKTEWINVNTIGNWTNWYGPWNSALRMHAAGNLYESDGSLQSRGSNGYYWSSSLEASIHGWVLNFNEGTSVIGFASKTFGNSLRCLKD
jgi:hypothetical protein